MEKTAINIFKKEKGVFLDILDYLEPEVIKEIEEFKELQEQMAKRVIKASREHMDLLANRDRQVSWAVLVRREPKALQEILEYKASAEFKDQKDKRDKQEKKWFLHSYIDIILSLSIRDLA
eukprot:m.219761 g.219761  ORF g.219761 m.219761 type:complete len:121 (+) comp39928_c0_seq7:177-539(+)